MNSTALFPLRHLSRSLWFSFYSTNTSCAHSSTRSTWRMNYKIKNYVSAAINSKDTQFNLEFTDLLNLIWLIPYSLGLSLVLLSKIYMPKGLTNPSSSWCVITSDFFSVFLIPYFVYATFVLYQFVYTSLFYTRISTPALFYTNLILHFYTSLSFVPVFVFISVFVFIPVVSPFRHYHHPRLREWKIYHLSVKIIFHHTSYIIYIRLYCVRFDYIIINNIRWAKKMGWLFV